LLPPAAVDLVRHDLERDDVVMDLAAAGFGLAFGGRR
jgi:O-methyltransferase involved in polyketide biosynthesis